MSPDVSDRVLARYASAVAALYVVALLSLTVAQGYEIELARISDDEAEEEEGKGEVRGNRASAVRGIFQLSKGCSRRSELARAAGVGGAHSSATLLSGPCAVRAEAACRV